LSPRLAGYRGRVAKTGESRVAVHLLIFAGDFPAGFEKVPCRGLLARLAVGPTNAQEIPGVVEILLQPAVEGTLHSGANPARQVEIGCRDDDRFVFLFRILLGVSGDATSGRTPLR
jgi:hypothetical protein